ncbi:cytochrome c oxidase polypeptide I [Sulfolobus acidocaldarius DSM 639]|uniref:Cytochrome c oxidase polypeptide I n=4 Tax=Sulfolobus acidocaldarius TaxID=2285 RepID=Q4JCF7_SULAC|nr:cytochrome c oxidase polypeptide I [Sulfolobus acidocaldarius DSM 639]
MSMTFRNIIVTLFQLDKDWTTRIVSSMLILGVVWGALGVIDGLMVRIQESAWGIYGFLPFTPQEYFAGITLHAERTLFGFAQQIIFAIIIYLVIKLMGIQPRLKWLLNTAFVLLNISMMLMEGPILIYPSQAFDNYFSATIWYYLSPIGIPGYSLYVVSPLFFIGWILNDAFVYLAGFWIAYHMYIGTRNLKEKLPVPLLFFLVDILIFMIGYTGVTASDVWDILSFFGVVPMNALLNQIAFWIFGHSVVYMLWLPAVAALYLLIPMLANKPLFSDRMARISAILYLVFSNNVPIHHMYTINLPVELKFVQEALTYGVVIPSFMTFLNLWATAKGADVKWNIITAFTVTSFAGAILAGVTGIANATVSFDFIVNNSMWVVAHFHQMILLSIVPGAMAVLYVLIPMISGKMWYSSKMAWFHFWGYIVGVVILTVSFELLGFYGITRRAEIVPRAGGIPLAENLATAGAAIADIATLGWFINVILTIAKGSQVSLEGLSLGQIVGTVSMQLDWGSISLLKDKIPRIRKGLSASLVLAILGALMIVSSSIILASAGDATSPTDPLEWLWLAVFTLGIVMVAVNAFRLFKGL